MSEVRRIVVEAAVAGVVLLLVALGANRVHPDGLDLERDYFHVEDRSGAAGTGRTSADPAPDDPSPPVGAEESPAAGPGAPAGSDDAAPAADAEIAAVEARIRAEGLQTISHEEVAALYDDPIYRDGAYVFVDARKDAHYEAGHIPGAYQFDHFRMERYLDEVVPACQGALEVVVYCYGRDCTDSEIAAKHLRNFGVDPSSLHVYVPGIQGWCAAGRKIERGARGSGELAECDS